MIKVRVLYGGWPMVKRITTALSKKQHRGANYWWEVTELDAKDRAISSNIIRQRSFNPAWRYDHVDWDSLRSNDLFELKVFKEMPVHDPVFIVTRAGVLLTTNPVPELMARQIAGLAGEEGVVWRKA